MSGEAGVPMGIALGIVQGLNFFLYTARELFASDGAGGGAQTASAMIQICVAAGERQARLKHPSTPVHTLPHTSTHPRNLKNDLAETSFESQ